MKKLLLLCSLFVSLTAFSQAKKLVEKQDTGKKVINLPPAPPSQKIFYLLLPQDNWNKIIGMLRKSLYPSNEIDDAVNYIINNAKELQPPPITPGVNSTDSAKVQK